MHKLVSTIPIGLEGIFFKLVPFKMKNLVQTAPRFQGVLKDVFGSPHVLGAPC